MLEALNSKFLACKLHQAFKTSIEMFGGSPTHYRYLLQTEKLVEKRALKGKRAVNLSLGLNCTFGFIMSVVLAIMPLLFSIDVFTYALLGITMSMLMVGFWSLPSFDVLLSPINYPVVAHTPVSSRTYFLVKLTQVLTYAVALLASLNLLPAFSGIWTHPGDGAGHSFLFSNRLPASRLYVRLVHDWRDDNLRRIFDKTLHEKKAPKYCAICSVCVSRSFSQ